MTEPDQIADYGREPCGICGPWERHADDGECRYCGHVGKVKREPFGGEDACRKCWEQICYGEGE